MSGRIDSALPRLGPALCATVIFGIAINLLYLAVPIYFVQVYNRVLTGQSLETLVSLSVIAAIAIVAFAILDAARVLVVRRMGERIALSFFDVANQAGIARVAPAPPLRNDLDRAVRFFAPSGLIALLDFPWVFINAFVLFLMHPLLGAVALVGAAAIIAVALMKQTWSSEARIAAQIEERSSSLARRWEGRERHAIALGVWDGHEGSRRAAHHDHMAQTSSAFGRHAVGGAVIRGLRLAFLCGAIGCGAWLVIAGSIGPATMFAASMLLARALAPVEGGIAALCATPNVRRSWRRLAECASAPAAVPLIHAVDIRRGVEIAHASLRMPGSATPILSNISLALPPGEVLGVLGPSGSGKTMLAALLAGSVDPTVGRVRFGGVDTHALNASQGTRSIGYLPQQADPFQGSLAEAIGGGSCSTDAEIAEAAQLAGLTPYLETLPLGLNGPANEAAAHPAGVRQQIAIARAIRGWPLLVVLDEPTVHLDAQAERALVDAISALRARGSCVVVTSHRISALGPADKLLILRDGRLQTLGAKSTVLEALTRRAPVPAISDAARSAEAIAR